jgi:UDP-N-acetylmuramoyl-tripeptide--D-alanyl-D-alanine ligase
MLWPAKDIKKALNLSYTPSFDANYVCFNSKDIDKDDLFIALSGENHHGHVYVYDALNRGASLCIVEKSFEETFKGDREKLISVQSTTKALYDLARFSRMRAAKTTRIAITGSVGKTTFKELAYHTLSSYQKTHKSIKSYNNHVGVPYTLANMRKDSMLGLFEIGMNHQGEILPLSHLISPHIAIITSIAPAHIEHLKTIENIIQEKISIALALEKQGILLLNQCHPYALQMDEAIEALKEKRPDIHIIPVGRFLQDDIYATMDGTTLRIYEKKAHHDPVIILKNKDLDEVLAEHITLMYALGVHLKIPIDYMKEAVTTFKKQAGRGEIIPLFIEGISCTLMDDSYNANPLSMMKSLDLFFKKYGHARPCLVLGEMLELGPLRDQAHKDIMDFLEKHPPHYVLFVGRGFANHLPKNASYAYDYLDHKDSLMDMGKKLIYPHIQEDTALFAKGSFGSGVHTFVNEVLKRDRVTQFFSR